MTRLMENVSVQLVKWEIIANKVHMLLKKFTLNIFLLFTENYCHFMLMVDELSSEAHTLLM